VSHTIQRALRTDGISFADDKVPCILEPELTDKAFRRNWARLIQKICIWVFIGWSRLRLGAASVAAQYVVTHPQLSHNPINFDFLLDPFLKSEFLSFFRTVGRPFQIKCCAGGQDQAYPRGTQF
jgi:hypothetical protein